MSNGDLFIQLIRDKLHLNIVAASINKTYKLICTSTGTTTTNDTTVRLLNNLNANIPTSQWTTYNRKSISTPTTNNQWSTQYIQQINTNTLTKYQLQGHKILIQNKHNKREKGWVCAGKYGENLSQTCTVIEIAKLSITTNIDNNHDDNKQMHEIDRQRNKYNPMHGNRLYSHAFKSFKDKSIINTLNDVNENADYWEGWLRVEDSNDVDTFIWSHCHQTQTVYIDRREHHISSSKIHPLQYQPYAPDKQLTNKYTQHIKTIRYDCQRAKQRGAAKQRKTNKQAPGSIKTGCKCYINVKIFDILQKTDNDEMNQISQIAVISDNHSYLHNHPTVWLYVQYMFSLLKNKINNEYTSLLYSEIEELLRFIQFYMKR